ncbi:hypothetical protein NLM16_27165 [Bradyrhizobium brasilense]|uniref:phage tail protein n=1 Tax=Bradyrhizobium brasilense TaxID=1419277 RepID=UPI002877FFEE|nr:hypothetical protein [Bradyrhizobium brasilense]MCP3417794.1 hypothetical protein [Bradyrhizobium brasilense]
MSAPQPYTPDYSFSGYQANNPTAPPPGSNLDAQFAQIAAFSASIVAALNDLRRSDGALKNQIVTFDSLAQALQLLVDPTNGQLVADAVATAQAAQASATMSASAAATSETNAANSAAAAAASAGSVNLSAYLSKAGNLAGIGNAFNSRTNIWAMARDGTDAVGRLAPNAGLDITDYNSVIATGYYSSGPGAANAPDSSNYWLVHVSTADYTQNYITQIAYQFANASAGADSVLVYRRNSYVNAGTRAWTPWISHAAVPVGTTIWVNALSAPPGFVKENGALLSRASYPALWNYANNSGNIVSEAAWSGGNSGAFSTGDLVTTFRLPDARGEFFRAYDDGRGVDAGRAIYAHQADSLKDHTHAYTSPASGAGTGTTPNYFLSSSASAQTGSPSTGAASETRPRNNAKLACIKF